MLSVGYWLKQTQPNNLLFDTRIVATGEVLTVVTEFDEGRFTFNVTEFRVVDSEQHFSVNHNVRLSWREPSFALQQGQKLQLELRLKPRWGLANEAGFDYQQWLFAHHIVATGYVVTSSENAIIHVQQSTRQTLAEEFMALNIPEIRWFLALAIGYRGALMPEDWTLLRKTGTAHLVAISGMHLGMVALWCYGVFIFILVVLPIVFHRNGPSNIRLQALLLSIMPCAFYTSLAGFSIPTLRAFLMLSLAVSLMKLNINWGFTRFILASVTLFILLFPLSIFTMSFWLSFSALMIIGFLLWRFTLKAGVNGITYKLRYFIRMQFCMTLLMLPLVLLFFGGASMVSPLANIVAVPFVTFVLLPLSLLVTCLQMIDSELAYSILNITLFLFAEFESLLRVFAELPASWITFGAVKSAVGIYATIAVTLMLLPRFIVPKIFYLVLFVPLVSGFYQEQKG